MGQTFDTTIPSVIRTSLIRRKSSPPAKSLYFDLTRGCFIRGSFKADTFLAIKGVQPKYKPKPHEHKTLRNIAQVGGYH
jgi:hypothetical protein